MRYNFNPFTGNFDTTPDPLTVDELTVNTLLTADHIHGNIAGSVYIHVKNTDIVQLDKGTPFYISGTVGASDRVEIKAADSSDPTKGPAVGLVETDLAVNGEGNGVIIGEIFNYDTDTPNWSTNDPLYVANGGGITNVQPTTGYRQIVAYVGRIQQSTGTLVLTGSSTDPVAGSNTEIQYNDNGGFGASADLTWDDTGKELGVGGDITLDDGGTYATTLQLITPTANRTISFPDATGTVGLVAGSSGQLVYNNAGAYAGAPSTSVGATGNITLSLAGAASTPPVSLTGTWFSGGTSTTTKPQFLIEPTGTTSTAWSTSGTGLGVNAASGFAGNLLDLQVNGSSKLYVNKDGNIAVSAGSQSAPSLTFTGDPNTGIYSPGADQVAISTNGTGRLFVDANGNVEVKAGNLTLGPVGAEGGQLNIRNTTNTGTVYALDASTDANARLFTTNNNCDLQIGQLVGTGGTIQLFTGSSERLRIDSSGTFRVKGAGTAGVNDAVQLNGSAPANSLLLDASGRLLVGTSTARSNYLGITPNFQFEHGTGNNQRSFAITHNDTATAGPLIFIGKSRGSTVGSNTLVASGDELGQITFNGADGTNMILAAAIRAEVDGTPGANDMPGRLVFATTPDGASSPTERVRIQSGGTTSFGQGAAGPGSGTAGTLIAAGDGGILITNNTSPFLRCYTLNGGFPNALQIASDGNVTNANNSYGGISDSKLKENIVDATSQWSDIKALQVRKYNFKEETGQLTHTQIGLIAQEVELVSPGLVTKSPDRDEEGNDLGTVTKSVNYSVLYMKAVKALQEAMERIETLEAKVAALESA